MTDGARRPVMVPVNGIGDFHVQVLAGIADVLNEHGIPLLIVAIHSFDGGATSDIVLDLIRRRTPLGVIALGDGVVLERLDLAETLIESDLPVVTLGLRFGTAPRVYGDNVTGMRALMGHLLDERGVRRPALVRGTQGHSDSLAREEVFREECLRRGIEVDEDLMVEGAFRAKPAYDRFREVLQRRQDVDAVVAMNDPSAFGVLSALTDHGLHVPDDVLVCGFDNTRDSAASWPPLTTIDQNLRDQGARAASLLLRRLAGLACPQETEVPSTLVVRASTAGTDVRTEDLLASARALQSRVTLQELAVQISCAMAACRTVADVVTTMGPCLTLLGVGRCFLALDRPTLGSRNGTDPAGHPTTLALAYRNGRAEPVPDETFPRHELLPPSLRSELDRGGLLLQVLSINGRERGYLLYELNTEHPVLLEALRIELPRTIEMVFSSNELKDHAATLEQLVIQRTSDLERVNAELQRSVMCDGLTGIANRRAFEGALEKACHPGDGPGPARLNGSRTGWVALLMIDVDMFKAYNDRYGHLAGDDALRTVAECVKQSVHEPGDLACRYGGEEFAVILDDCEIEGALAVAKRFANRLAKAAIVHHASLVAPVVTASVGVAAAEVTPELDPADLIAAADQALYRAKAQGRDRIVAAEWAVDRSA